MSKELFHMCEKRGFPMQANDYCDLFTRKRANSTKRRCYNCKHFSYKQIINKRKKAPGKSEKTKSKTEKK